LDAEMAQPPALDHGPIDAEVQTLFPKKLAALAAVAAALAFASHSAPAHAYTQPGNAQSQQQQHSPLPIRGPVSFRSSWG
jgi:hypothetical protein